MKIFSAKVDSNVESIRKKSSEREFYRHMCKSLTGKGFTKIVPFGGIYFDLLYVEDLMLPETINTLPDATLAALADHARIQHRQPPALADAQNHYAQLDALGIHMDKEIAQNLQTDGLRLFQQGFEALLTQVNQ